MGPSWVKLEPCWPSWAQVWVSWGHLDSKSGVLEAMLALTGGLWGPCWLQVVGSGGHVGSNFEELCAIWPICQKPIKLMFFQCFLGVGGFGIEAKLVMLGPFFGHLGSKLEDLGPTWLQVGGLGASLAPSRGSWDRLGSKLGPSWAQAGAKLGKLVPSWGQVGPSWRHVDFSRFLERARTGGNPPFSQ